MFTGIVVNFLIVIVVVVLVSVRLWPKAATRVSKLNQIFIIKAFSFVFSNFVIVAFRWFFLYSKCCV